MRQRHKEPAVFPLIFAPDLTRVTRAAKAEARRRLLERPQMDVDALLDECELDGQVRGRARTLLGELARTIDVPPGVFRPEDRLQSLFCVNFASLGSDAVEVGRKYRQGACIEVFTRDILYMLETHSDPEGWEKVRSAFPKPPRGEEWIDLFLPMRIAEFLATFSMMLPTVP